MGVNLMVGGSLMHSDQKPDFSGYATKVGLKCTDGRTIMPDAFKHQDSETVPLVWHHNHDDPENVLGHAVLEHRQDGIYTYGFFNDTKKAQSARELVKHKDIKALSIYANQLVERSASVFHGMIREVSLVVAGANPGALIDNISLAHGDDVVTLDDEAIIYTGLTLTPSEEIVHENDGPTVQEVYDSMTEEQKTVVHYMVGAAMENSKGQAEHSSVSTDDSSIQQADDNKKGTHMSRNLFEATRSQKTEAERHVLTHDAMRGIAEDAVRRGSMKEAVEAYALQHGIDNIDILFPDAKLITSTPEFDKRRTEWVSAVINGTHKSPFSRIKSITADITHDEARARGYIKGNLKKEEFFGLVKRVTTPSTIYKKQKLDRDDIIDIVDLDVVAWLKAEMRLMLDEELARAVLIGDGRDVLDEDKVKDPAGATEGAGIRSILNDDDLYAATVNVNIDDANSSPQEIVDAIMLNMRFYKGSGSPTFYTTLPMLTKMLMIKDTLGRRIYRTASDLASELGVGGIQTVEVMESMPDLIGIVVNLQDYTIGADKGGEVSFFDDFDIDYNQYKYLLETRVSGALTKIRSALVVKKVAAASVLAVPAAPDWDDENFNIDINDTTGVVYRRADTNAIVEAADNPIQVAAGQSLTIRATPEAGYYFSNNIEDEWTFTRPAA